MIRESAVPGIERHVLQSSGRGNAFIAFTIAKGLAVVLQSILLLISAPGNIWNSAGFVFSAAYLCAAVLFYGRPHQTLHFVTLITTYLALAVLFWMRLSDTDFALNNRVLVVAILLFHTGVILVALLTSLTPVSFAKAMVFGFSFPCALFVLELVLPRPSFTSVQLDEWTDVLRS